MIQTQIIEKARKFSTLVPSLSTLRTKIYQIIKRIIGVREVGGKPRVYVFGNDIDGTIASVRRLIDNKNIFLNKDAVSENTPPIYLSEEDIDAIYVYDYLHTNESEGSFRTDTPKFAEYVGNVLRAETYNIAIKRVLTANEDNVSLRLKNKKWAYCENG